MTFPETTTPTAATETAPQPCGDDPFGLANIPDFLRRAPKPTGPARATLPSTPDGGEAP